jgi:hypothetical protein
MWRIIVLLAFSFVDLAFGQAVPSLSKAGSYLDFRPMKERRLWTYVMKDSTIGQLISTVEEKRNFDGQDAIVIQEDLHLTFNRPDGKHEIRYSSSHFVTKTGAYLGDDFKVGTGTQNEFVKIRRMGEYITSVSERGGVQRTDSLAAGQSVFAWDNLFVDQLESYLALRDIKVGDILDDSVFTPFPMVKSHIKGKVDGYGYIRLYNEKFDSLFIVLLSEPQQFKLYYSKDRKLQKIEAPQQNLKIYLDMVSMPSNAPKQSTPFSIGTLIQGIPGYCVFFLISAVMFLFFSKFSFRFGDEYYGLVSGIIAFLGIPFIQSPLQEVIVNSVVLPSIRSGSPVLAAGIIPSLVSGIIPIILLWAAINSVVQWKKIKPQATIIVGALCGVGFGLFEACYIWYGQKTGVLSIPFLILSFMVVFHISTAIVIGAVIRKGLKSIGIISGVFILLKSLLLYMPLLIQQHVASIGILLIVHAVITLGAIAVAVYFATTTKK